jgi:hypothetical protein
MLQRCTKKLKFLNFKRMYNYDSLDPSTHQDLSKLKEDTLFKGKKKIKLKLLTAYMTELEDMENSIWMEFNMKNIPRNEFTVGETKKIIFAQRKAIKEKYQKMKKDRENPKKKEKVELKLHQILNNLDEDASFLKFKESFTKESGVKFENQKFSENEVEGFLDLLKNDEKFKKG